jgi:hypothetical protein
MRWDKPKFYSVRYKKGFLLFPKRIGRRVRWLEYAEWSERYLGNQRGWAVDEWLDIINLKN